MSGTPPVEKLRLCATLCVSFSPLSRARTFTEGFPASKNEERSTVLAFAAS